MVYSRVAGKDSGRSWRRLQINNIELPNHRGALSCALTSLEKMFLGNQHHTQEREDTAKGWNERLMDRGRPEWTKLHLTSFARLQHPLVLFWTTYCVKTSPWQAVVTGFAVHDLTRVMEVAKKLNDMPPNALHRDKRNRNLSLHPSSWLCLHVKWIPTPSARSTDNSCPTGLFQQSTHTS